MLQAPRGNEILESRCQHRLVECVTETWRKALRSIRTLALAYIISETVKKFRIMRESVTIHHDEKNVAAL